LTQLIIRNKAHQHNWPISTYVHPASKTKTTKEVGDEGGLNKDKKTTPKGIQLPRDIFSNLTDHQAGLDVSTLPYTELIDRISETNS
jgi:hypothetical protein